MNNYYNLPQYFLDGVYANTLSANVYVYSPLLSGINLNDRSIALLFANIDSVFTTVQSNSSIWILSGGNGSSFNSSEIAANSANWNNTFTIVSVYSGDWQYITTFVHDNSASWLLDNNFNSIDLVANSGNWQNTYSLVNSNSADWVSTTITVRANSASWVGGAGFDSSDLVANSANWSSVYTTVRNNSGDWENTETTVRSNSAFWNTDYHSIGITLAGVQSITTGIKGDVEIPYACTIQRVTLLGDVSGTLVVDIWKDTYNNFPPTSADSITGGNYPTLSGTNKYQDTTLTSWTVNIVEGDILRFNVLTAATLARAHLILKVVKV